MKIIDLMSKEELAEYQDKASLIITHGGVGSIISSIEKGKKDNLQYHVNMNMENM